VRVNVENVYTSEEVIAVLVKQQILLSPITLTIAWMLGAFAG
jgi:hypothetical protein